MAEFWFCPKINFKTTRASHNGNVNIFIKVPNIIIYIWTEKNRCLKTLRNSYKSFNIYGHWKTNTCFVFYINLYNTFQPYCNYYYCFHFITLHYKFCAVIWPFRVVVLIMSMIRRQTYAIVFYHFIAFRKQFSWQ